MITQATIDPKTLCDQILNRSTPPEEGFEQFIVGDSIINARSFIVNKIADIANKNAPSQILIVTADNGNGKTLLDNYVKYHLGTLNIPNTQDRLLLHYFFTHVKAYNVDPTLIGGHIARSLQIHTKLEPTFTYNLISLQIFQEFLKSYKLPFSVKATTNPLKWSLKAAVHFLDTFIGGMATDILREASGVSFDAANERAQYYLARRKTRERFLEYCQSGTLGKVIFDHSNEGKKLSPSQLNESIYTALENGRLLASPDDTVRELRDIVGAVQAKILVVMIDDANDEELLHSLVQLINGLSELDSNSGGNMPRVFVIISLLKQIYENIIKKSVRDKALQQRLSFGNKIELPRPTSTDIELLMRRLITLRNVGYPGNPKHVSDTDVKRIAKMCCMNSYRESISCIRRELGLENSPGSFNMAAG